MKEREPLHYLLGHLPALALFRLIAEQQTGEKEEDRKKAKTKVCDIRDGNGVVPTCL